MKLHSHLKPHFEELPLNYRFLESHFYGNDKTPPIIIVHSSLHQTTSKNVVQFHIPLNLYFPLHYISNEK